MESNIQEREDNTHVVEMDGNSVDLQINSDYLQTSRKRRTNETDEDESWKVVYKTVKRRRSLGNLHTQVTEEKVEVSITCKEALPKQFKMAKLLKANNINNIYRIKYVNPFKVMIQFEDESDLIKLINCTEFKENAWVFTKTMEVGITYGVIKNIELDCEDKEIMESLSCDAELISIKRLSRRKSDGSGWTESETIRICFKGSSLPAYIYMYGIRINVEPYVYPVTQCSNCWKFGHFKRICPNKKMVCPKCSKNHECCETTLYTCVNCKGDHMALNKICPIYVKEKKIRSIMSHFNCTYKKALKLYVPSWTPIPNKEILITGNSEPYPESRKVYEKEYTNLFPIVTTPLYSTVCANDITTVPTTSSNKTKSTTTNMKRKQHRQKVNDISFDWECLCSDQDCDNSKKEEDTTSNKKEDDTKSEDQEKKRKFSDKIKQLYEKLKAVIFNEKNTLEKKFKICCQILLEWLIQLILNSIFDSTCFKSNARNGDVK